MKTGIRRAFGAAGIFLLIAGAAGAADAPRKGGKPLEDSSFVYGVFAGEPTCEVVEKRLTEVSLRPTVLLSAESRGFILDQPDGAELLTCALRNLQSRGLSAKALLLQDTSFLARQEESARRIKMMADFAHDTGLPIAGVVIDVEPYVDERWSCASLPERRKIGSEYRDLLRALKRVSGHLAVEAVIPWWFVLNDDIPELLPDSILEVADGVYFMVYGDEGGPVVDGRAEKIFGRLPTSSLPTRRGRSYIALAAYESQSPSDLESEITQVRDHYGSQRGFAGTAVFHATSDYNAPLVRVLSGVVTDASGQGVPAAQVECSGVKAEANACGKFTVRGMQEERATLTVTKPGYEPRSVTVDLAPPGRERELPPIQLSPKKD